MSTKHIKLTEDEFAAYQPNFRIVQRIEAYCKERQISPHEMKILDWGCGRGRMTLWLREKGYDAYGTDIDQEPIRNGSDLFESKGHPADVMRLLSSDGTVDFDDDSFDFIFSQQVFEHISDIDQVAAEMSRLTNKDGQGFHIYPARLRVMEGHLRMPFVHWLPKNGLRRMLIRFFVQLGIEPHWPELSEKGRGGKADVYYKYSCEKTFYRRRTYLTNLFRHLRFDLQYSIVEHPSVRNHALLGVLTKTKLTSAMLSFFLLTFLGHELLVTKH